MENQIEKKPAVVEGSEPKKKKRMTLADFKVKSFVTDLEVDDSQFLKTSAG